MIFQREFKYNFSKMISWLIVLSILSGLLIASYPLMLNLNMKSIFDRFVQELTPDLKIALGFGNSYDYTNIGEYLSFIFQYVGALIAIYAMQLGASSLSKEQSLGSIQYIYSNPISRAEIVTGKIFANIATYIITLVILAFISVGVVILLPLEEPVVMSSLVLDMTKIFVGLFASGIVYMAIGFFYSSITNTSNFAEGFSLLFVLLTVAIFIVGSIMGDAFASIVELLPLEVFNPFNFIKNDISILGMCINLAIAVVFILLSYLAYNTKELNY